MGALDTGKMKNIIRGRRGSVKSFLAASRKNSVDDHLRHRQ